MTRLAVIGNPVAHSRSPEIHHAFARNVGVHLSYEKKLAGLDEFERVADQFVAGGGRGFNVTLPFKGDAFNWVTERSEAAIRSEAVNTVSISESGRIRGENTDGSGLVKDLIRNLGWQLRDQRILVLGAGGAVSGVMPALIGEGPMAVHLFNRTFERAQALQARYDARVRACTSADLEDCYDVVVSGTSAGLHSEMQVLPDRIIGHSTRCYDMIYGPGVTRFNQWASEAGCMSASDGLGMLVEQAALAFEIWFGIAPETSSVMREMRTMLEQNL